jgi:NAD(P)-dependent dehydrogenase (short-subunit alcohol dehydrogenase family)
MNTLRDLKDAVVVVTGAGRGIGAAIVKRLMEAGASVFAVVEPGTAPAPEFDELVADGGTRLRVTGADVRSTADMAAAAAAAVNAFGHIDALINNAGVIQPIGLLGDVDPDAWANVLAVNAGGAMRCTRAFLPHLLARRGVVVNMSSGAGYRALEGWSAYCASKAALVMVSRSTDLEYRDQGLRVFSLGIPPTDTVMQASIRASGINDVSRIPQQSLTPPSVIAAVAAWLCGPAARNEIKKLEIDVRDPEFNNFNPKNP